MRDVYAENQFPVDPQMSAIFDETLTPLKAGRLPSPELEVFLRVASHSTVEPVLKQMGFSGRVLDMVARQVWAPKEGPEGDDASGVLASPRMALQPVVIRAFVESVARGGGVVTPRDMTIAFLDQRPKPVDLVIERLESGLGFDAGQTIQAIRTAPQEFRRSVAMTI
jgi:hypothetical protein